MGPVTPFVPLIASGVGALFGSRRSAASKQLGALSGKQMGFGDTMTGLSGGALSNVNNYLTPLVQGNQQALADWTASSAADQAKQVQQLTNRYARGSQRGASVAMLTGQLPMQQMATGLANRIAARQAATQQLAQVGVAEGGLGNQAYSGAGQSAMGMGQLDLEQGQMARNTGLGIAGILTGKSPTGEGTLLDKIIGIFKKGSAGSSPTGPGTMGSGASSGAWAAYNAGVGTPPFIP